MRSGCTAFLFSISLLFCGFSTSVWADPIAGSTFVFQRHLMVPSGETCPAALAGLTAALFGAQSEHRHLAMAASLFCVNDPEFPLLADVIFEPQQDGDFAELQAWMPVLANESWLGESLAAQHVTTIFWDTYGEAVKADGSYLDTFESPRQAASFAEVLTLKNAAKAALASPKVTDFSNYLQSQLGATEVARWQKSVLPRAKQVQLQIPMYFLTEDGAAVKSSIVYEIERDCGKLPCL